MRRSEVLRALAITVLLTGVTPVAHAQTLPPGFRVVQVTSNPYYEPRPRINKNGQVVFMAWHDNVNRSTEEIYLYDSRTGALTRLTNDNIQDVSPDINDEGIITWVRGIGPVDPNFGEPSHEIMLRRSDGTVIRVTDNGVYDGSPRVNNFGEIVWQQDGPWACGGPTKDIYMWDGQQVAQVTFDGWPDQVENQSPVINDFGDIAWTRYDFCAPGQWQSEIMLRVEGLTQVLTDRALQPQPQEPSINNLRRVAWYRPNPANGRKLIELWQDGVTSVLTDNGGQPALSDRGHVAFASWSAVRSTWDMWLLRAGRPYVLAADAFENIQPDINATGEVAWSSGGFPNGDIRALIRYSVGDLNCDTRIDAFDIEPFTLALFDPPRYAQLYPACDASLADINEDGSSNAFDIEPFVEILFP